MKGHTSELAFLFILFLFFTCKSHETLKISTRGVRSWTWFMATLWAVFNAWYNVPFQWPVIIWGAWSHLVLGKKCQQSRSSTKDTAKFSPIWNHMHKNVSSLFLQNLILSDDYFIKPNNCLTLPYFATKPVLDLTPRHTENQLLRCLKQEGKKLL